MTPFYGDNHRPRITGQTRGKTFSWLFVTGAAVTCMNKHSFKMAFKNNLPKKISKG
jgi:hypothetical protein